MLVLTYTGKYVALHHSTAEFSNLIPRSDVEWYFATFHSFSTTRYIAGFYSNSLPIDFYDKQTCHENVIICWSLRFLYLTLMEGDSTVGALGQPEVKLLFSGFLVTLGRKYVLCCSQHMSMMWCDAKEVTSFYFINKRFYISIYIYCNLFIY